MATKSTAKKRPAAKRVAAKRPAAKKKAPAKKARKASVTIEGFKLEKGQRTLHTEDGREFGSVVCGEHNSVPIVSVQDEHVVSMGGRKHVKPDEPAGFQPDCEDCITEATSTIDAMRRYAQV